MRNTILGLAFLLCCASCKKEDAQPVAVYGTPYAKSGVSTISATRLFARSGEIKDVAAVSRFDAYDSANARYAMNQRAINPNAYIDTILFESRTRASTSAYSQRSFYDISTYNNAFLFASKDTLTGLSLGTEYRFSFRRFLPDPQNILYSEDISYVFQGEYYFNHRFQKRFQVRPTGDAMEVPLMNYTWYRPGFISTDILEGALDPDFHTHIADGDTVVVREFTIRYNK